MLLHPKSIDITLQKQCDCDKQIYKITLIAIKKSNKNERPSLFKEIEQDLDTQKTLIQNEENII